MHLKESYAVSEILQRHIKPYLPRAAPSLNEFEISNLLQAIMGELLDEPALDLARELLNDMHAWNTTATELACILRFQIYGQYRDLMGFISTSPLKELKAEGYPDDIMVIYAANKPFSLTGLQFKKFLLCHLYALLGIYFDLLTRPEVLGSKPVDIHTDQVQRMLEKEIFIVVNARIAQKCYSQAPEIELKEFAITFFNFLRKLKEGEWLCLPCGFKKHAIYLSLLRVGSRIHVLVDNVGDGCDGPLGGLDREGLVDIPVLGCFELTEEFNENIIAYLMGVCIAEREEKPDALPKIYNQAPFQSWVKFAFSLGEAPLPRQTAENCVVHNFKIGMMRRFAPFPALFPWLFEKLANRIVDSRLPSEVGGATLLAQYTTRLQAELTRISNADVVGNMDVSSVDLPLPERPTSFVARVPGRDAEKIARLTSPQPHTTSVVVFHGPPGGVGKSTSATELAYQIKSRFPVVIYAQIFEKSNLLEVLRNIANSANLFSKEIRQDEKLLVTYWASLLKGQEKDTLLLIDDLNDEADKRVLNEILPHHSKAELVVIVSSTITTWPDTYYQQEIGFYLKEEALAYIYKRLRDAFTMLPKEIECIPLMEATFFNPFALKLALDELTMPGKKITIEQYLEKHNGDPVTSADMAVSKAWERIKDFFSHAPWKNLASIVLETIAYYQFQRFSQTFFEEILSTKRFSGCDKVSLIRLLSIQTSLLTRLTFDYFSMHPMLAKMIINSHPDIKCWEKALMTIVELAERRRSYQDRQKNWGEEFSSHVWYMIHSLSIENIPKLSEEAIVAYVRLMYLFVKRSDIVGSNIKFYVTPMRDLLQQIIESRQELKGNGITKYYAYLAACFLNIYLENYDAAIRNANEALTVSEKVFIDRPSKIANAYFHVGCSHWYKFSEDRQKQHLQIALDHYRKASEICERLEKASRTNSISNGLGLVYLEMGGEHLKEATLFLEKALKIREEERPQDFNNLSAIVNNIACVYYKYSKIANSAEVEKNLAIAKYYYGLSLTYSNQFQVDNLYQAHELRNLGRIYFEYSKLDLPREERLRNLKQAEQFHKEAWNIRIRLLNSNSKFTASSSYKLAQVYLARAQLGEDVERSLDNAKYYLDDALLIREQIPGSSWYMAKILYYRALVACERIENGLAGKESFEIARKDLEAASRILQEPSGAGNIRDQALLDAMHQLEVSLREVMHAFGGASYASTQDFPETASQQLSAELKTAIEENQKKGLVRRLFNLQAEKPADFQVILALVIDYAIEKQRPVIVQYLKDAGFALPVSAAPPGISGAGTAAGFSPVATSTFARRKVTPNSLALPTLNRNATFSALSVVGIQAPIAPVSGSIFAAVSQQEPLINRVMTAIQGNRNLYLKNLLLQDETLSLNIEALLQDVSFQHRKNPECEAVLQAELARRRQSRQLSRYI